MDEVWFYFYEYVNSQNSKQYDPETCNQNEHLLHSNKIFHEDRCMNFFK